MNYLFEGADIVNNFGRPRFCLPPERKAGLFTAQYNKDSVSLQGKVQANLLPGIEDLGSLCLGFLPYTAATGVHPSSSPVHLSPWDSRSGH